MAQDQRNDDGSRYPPGLNPTAQPFDSSPERGGGDAFRSADLAPITQYYREEQSNPLVDDLSSGRLGVLGLILNVVQPSDQCGAIKVVIDCGLFVLRQRLAEPVL